MPTKKLEKLYKQRAAIQKLISVEQDKELRLANNKYLGRYYKKEYVETNEPIWYLYSYVFGLSEFGGLYGIQFSIVPDGIVSIESKELDSYFLTTEIGEKEFIAAYMEFLNEINLFTQRFPFDVNLE